MNCCRKQSYSPVSFRKEPWASGLPGQPVAGRTRARMGSVGNEGSLCLPAVDCFSCFRTQPLPVEVLPGVFDALFSIFMGFFFLFFIFFCKKLQALATCCFLPALHVVFPLKCGGFFVSGLQLARSWSCLAGVPTLVCSVPGV